MRQMTSCLGPPNSLKARFKVQVSTRRNCSMQHHPACMIDCLGICAATDSWLLGAESVAVAKDGSLYMLDKFGFVWRARANAAGGYDLEKEPLAQLGSGRPLGFHFDAEGNLIVCNAGAVSTPAACSTHSKPCTIHSPSSLRVLGRASMPQPCALCLIGLI